MTEIWQTLSWEECPNCGTDDIEAQVTTGTPLDHVGDGDEIRCKECGGKGWASVDEGSAYIHWKYTEG